MIGVYPFLYTSGRTMPCSVCRCGFLDRTGCRIGFGRTLGGIRCGNGHRHRRHETSTEVGTQTVGKPKTGGERSRETEGTEMGDRLRAIIADLKGELPDMRNWQEVSSKVMRHLWLSDCESLVSHLKNPKNERLENSRLSIDIQGLKQLLWEMSDGTNLEEHLRL